ncbi:hypothetical protein JCM31826_21120 [Thermaurantimonas aggregans]|uniref:Uncharacterized protein n=1 Tax=Thermaurantimonas aggregans TaxID=2173829 RepID=A0A401XNQ2_9FLAO|nr:hypothetical protein [Thermaurantimonas aggregans]MCX8147684.1 hypothetical protein [Thermaurantimonas aggregans]GCD78630.1 hypothetical protein JCM31826_21120 [Thermaurantimonas aggregans]
MSKFIFFRTPKPKGFSYKPLYYDESKERIEKLKKQLSDAESIDAADVNREALRIELRHNIQRLRNTKPRSASMQNIRLLLILMALLFLFWYLLKPVVS